VLSSELKEETALARGEVAPLAKRIRELEEDLGKISGKRAKF
jgi:hypothetical protein